MIRGLVKIAYKEAEIRGIKDQDLVLDITGGTASITAAMTMVSALSKNRKLEYLKPKERNENGQPVIEKGSNPLTIDLIVPGEDK